MDKATDLDKLVKELQKVIAPAIGQQAHPEEVEEAIKKNLFEFLRTVDNSVRESLNEQTQQSMADAEARKPSY